MVFYQDTRDRFKQPGIDGLSKNPVWPPSPGYTPAPGGAGSQFSKRSCSYECNFLWPADPYYLEHNQKQMAEMDIDRFADM